VYIWPTHYPAQCPPPHAAELKGTIYRFINGKAPADVDFLSHYERKPAGDWGHAPCIARGLSVLRSVEDCHTMRAGVPALRKKRIAVASFKEPAGLIASTPSHTCEGHNTWWRTTPPSSLTLHFTNIEEALPEAQK
jgi:hypothetical protein